MNYKAIQRAQTELNHEGNEDRGRDGEQDKKSTSISEEEWIEVLKALNDKHE